MREVMLTYANALLAQSARLAASVVIHAAGAPRSRVVDDDDRMQTAELHITQDYSHVYSAHDAPPSLSRKSVTDRNSSNPFATIRILDRTELEKVSCSCYAIITAQQDGEQ